MELYLDCTSGISGDMTLAALGHLGVDFTPLTTELLRVGVDCRLELRPEARAGGPGFTADVLWNADKQPLRHPADIAKLFEKVNLPSRARQKAMHVLNALTAAEAHAHQIPPEQVHFHEVGAIDTLVDILGVCFGLDQLEIRRVTASPLPWFSGSVECAHGRIPLPAPATAYLLRGKPVFATDAKMELITPTGAALLEALVDDFVSGPTGIPVALGTGYGSRPCPSGLRAWLFNPDQGQADHETGGQEPVLQLETHIDHLNGEDLGAALSALSRMDEVLDVLWLPGVGKKNRPAGLLRVLCLPANQECVVSAVLRHTHTLGLRLQVVNRLVLPRKAVRTLIGGKSLLAKTYKVDGVFYARPEADALEETAKSLGVGIPALRNGSA